MSNQTAASHQRLRCLTYVINWLKLFLLYIRSNLGYTYDLSLGYSYTMACPSARGDNPRAVASGLSYVHVDKHGITIHYT